MRSRVVFFSLVTAVLLASAAGAQEIQVKPVQPTIQKPEITKRVVLDRRVLMKIKREIYFSDCNENPGAVYEVRAGKSELYRRPSGRVSAFAFAPWDPDRLFLLDANRNEIFQVDLGGPPAESLVYTHGTYVRDLAFDAAGALYFSEATGAGGNGRIWRIKPTGGASLFFTVLLSEIDGFWAGDFGFAPDGTLLLSAGNRVPASFYEADLATGRLMRLYHSPSEAITGFAHNADDALFITNNKSNIYTLDIDAGATTPAYTDAAQQRICDVGFRPSEDPGPAVPGLWVMPYGTRGFRIDQIKASGLVDYPTDSPTIFDAPFGGHLGFLLYSANAVPTPPVYYYRMLYRRQGSATWIDFDAPVFVHYVKNRPGTTPVFPLLQLGPNNINGRNLYRFRPHEPELPTLTGLPPGIPEWPKVGFPGDIYRGHLNTVALGLAPGKYRIRYEIYNQAGNPSLPGAAFQMIVPSGEDASGTLLTAPAAVVAGGFEFTMHIDNRSTEADIEPPSIGRLVTDDCGFLRYSPAAPGLVRIAWHAWHPAEFAVYRFKIVKGGTALVSLPLQPPMLAIPLPIRDEVGSPVHHGSAGDFYELSPTLELLGGCDEAAFAADLYVTAKAVNGNGDRLRQYDSHRLRAFAIAPEKPEK